jgi:hypothetical protein
MTIDYSRWLTPERLAVEEQLWAEGKFYERYAAGIKRLINEGAWIKGVVEFGAGTGWVPTALDDAGIVAYECVDINYDCINLAQRKNSHRDWVFFGVTDLRAVRVPTPDLACSFAVLKHFKLEEWQQLFVNLFSGASYALFTVATTTGPSCTDDAEFTHVRLSESDLAVAIAAAGHVELWRDYTDPEEPMIATRKVPA